MSLKVHVTFTSLALIALPAFAGDWDPKLAAQYLDNREKQWLEWKAAAADGGVCFSCHTNMAYLFARPALRRHLQEKEPTSSETSLLASLRNRVDRTDPATFMSKFKAEPLSSQALGVEAVFSALFLTTASNSSTSLAPDAKQAFDRLWARQIRDGAGKGSWSWFSLDLDPWETPHSTFYGASLAALALGSTPAAYRDNPEVTARAAALESYLKAEEKSQPLHNRLMLLWASSKLPSVLPSASRQGIVDEVLRLQQPDGSWTLQSLGPWKERPTAPASFTEPNSYATSMAAYILQTAGVTRSNPKLARSLVWLRTHQDRQTGAWTAASMNKEYKPDSMQIRFMDDAATAFASMALIGPE